MTGRLFCGRLLWPSLVALSLGATPALAQGSFFADQWAFLSLGFVIGMAHALDADHLAAVAAMTDQHDGRRKLILRGALWGFGHTAALFAVCSTVLVLGLSISGRVALALELAVGVMIVGLGLRVLWKLRRDRIHIHFHRHGQTRHIHAHSHADQTQVHAMSRHDHRHAARGHVATIAIGLLHGAAGSAALMVLTVAATDNIGRALVYFAVFGLGSMVGMSVLTSIASYPLGLVAKSSGWIKTATAFGIGGLAICVGGAFALDSLYGLWGVG